MEPHQTISVEQVTKELETLIRSYPDRTGRVNVNDNFECVYYSDEVGKPITGLQRPEWGNGYYSEPILKTPVCIVATWVEKFHPQLKQDEIIKSVLLKNDKINTVVGSCLSAEVIKVLEHAQDLQDEEICAWKYISFEPVVER